MAPYSGMRSAVPDDVDSKARSSPASASAAAGQLPGGIFRETCQSGGARVHDHSAAGAARQRPAGAAQRRAAQAQAAGPTALLVALALLLRPVGAADAIRAEQTYIEAFEKPRLDYTLLSFMREPGMLLELSRPAYSMELVAASCAQTETAELRELLFMQSVAVASRAAAGGSGITMLYCGMQDGRFIGYYEPTRYTTRASGASNPASAELTWAPYADADAAPASLSRKKPACDLLASTDDSAVCPSGCTTAGGCTGTATAKSISAACAGSVATADCTPTAADGTPGCCDKNVRAYYSTSVTARGAAVEATGWTIYDPRVRPWYTEEMARTTETGWSSVYVFSGSDELGITRTAKMYRDTAMSTHLGVLAADFELAGISSILNDTVAGTGSWAFVVERSTGKLLGTTFGAPLRDGTGERADMAAAGVASTTIIAAAAWLGANGWPTTTQGEALTNTEPGVFTSGPKYEAVTSLFTLGGLDWLIVVGQDIQCVRNERFVFGKCEDCPKGQVPLDDRSCVVCNDVHPGTVSDESIDGGTGTLQQRSHRPPTSCAWYNVISTHTQWTTPHLDLICGGMSEWFVVVCRYNVCMPHR